MRRVHGGLFVYLFLVGADSFCKRFHCLARSGSEEALFRGEGGGGGGVGAGMETHCDSNCPLLWCERLSRVRVCTWGGESGANKMSDRELNVDLLITSLLEGSGRKMQECSPERSSVSTMNCICRLGSLSSCSTLPPLIPWWLKMSLLLLFKEQASKQHSLEKMEKLTVSELEDSRMNFMESDLTRVPRLPFGNQMGGHF